MDRRTKFILLILGSAILFGLVVWLIVIPTLSPLFPSKPSLQPPGLPSELKPPAGTPPTGVQPTGGAAPAGGAGAVVSFQPSPATSAEAELAAELMRRAGALSERVESGSSANGFANLDDAALDVSPGLAQKFRQMRDELRKKHPAAGPVYLTIARRLVAKPESESPAGPTFKVVVQLQIQAQDAGQTFTAYLEAIVTFTKSGDKWIASGYESQPFAP